MRLIPKLEYRQALKINFIRRWIGAYRLQKSLLRRGIRTLDSSQSTKETLQHNLKSLKDFSNRRMELLIRPLSVIETVQPSSRVLLIGPRNENDLLIASTYLDIPIHLIRGLDLISYSKQIDLGDMHQMPYDDDQFDIVICGWTLSYSAHPQKLADEMSRVCAPGGLIAVGVEYSELDESGYRQLLGYNLSVPGMDRINSVPQILDLFGQRVDEVMFSHNAPNKISHAPTGKVDNPSSVATIFSVN
ncbi:MAG: class I SAM-dependent methyltransferase [Planctomycetota bacterium]